MFVEKVVRFEVKFELEKFDNFKIQKSYFAHHTTPDSVQPKER